MRGINARWVQHFGSAVVGVWWWCWLRELLSRCRRLPGELRRRSQIRDRTDNDAGSSSQAWTPGSAIGTSSPGRVGPTGTAASGSVRSGGSVGSGRDRATAANHGVGRPSIASAADNACPGGHCAPDGYNNGGQYAGHDDRAAQAAAHRSADDRGGAGDDDHSELARPGAAGAS